MWVEDSGDSFRQRATHLVWADTPPLFDRAPEESVPGDCVAPSTSAPVVTTCGGRIALAMSLAPSGIVGVLPHSLALPASSDPRWIGRPTSVGRARKWAAAGVDLQSTCQR